MGLRRLVASTAVLSVAAGLLAGGAALATDAARADLPDDAFGLDVLLTTAPDLPADARRTLIDETERIWRRAGVRLRWPSTVGAGAGAEARMRVLVMARAVAGEANWPVGELLPTGQGGTVPVSPANGLAIASISGARRVLAAAGHGEEPGAIAAARLGVVLGRAVAHEIGHYLLATPTHATRGLMRAHIDAREFADLRSGAFYLDKDAGRWVRGMLAGAARRDYRLLPFSYRRDH